MITKNWIYLKLQELTPEIRLNNKLKPETKNRLDCVTANIPDNNLRGMSYFINKRGQMFFNKTLAKDIVKADLKRQAVWMLTGKSINISSLYIDIPEYPQYSHGNPPHAEIIGRKKPRPNPFLLFRNDLFLFIINSDYTVIELIIIPEQKNLWNTYYLKLIQGEFDELIQNLRNNASTFFDYGL